MAKFTAPSPTATSQASASRFARPVFGCPTVVDRGSHRTFLLWAVRGRITFSSTALERGHIVAFIVEKRVRAVVEVGDRMAATYSGLISRRWAC